MTTTTAEPVRIAAWAGICIACDNLIAPGNRIRKPPGRAWRHADCENPWGSRRRKNQPEERVGPIGEANVG